MSLFTDLREVFTPYAQRIKNLEAEHDGNLLIYSLNNTVFTRNVKFIFGSDTAYPFVSSNNAFVTYKDFNLTAEPGKRYTIKATVPSKYSSALMMVVFYNQKLLTAYNNHASANTSLNVKTADWGELEQVVTAPTTINDSPCVGMIISLRQAPNNPEIAEDFVVSVNVEKSISTTPSYKGYVTKPTYPTIAHVVNPGSYWIPYAQNYSDAPARANGRLFVFMISSTQVCQFCLSALNSTARLWYRNVDIKTQTAVTEWVAINDFPSDQYVTPQMYGAKGDGVTDDTAAFQNAINSGQNVYVPLSNGQKYVISDTLIVNKQRQQIYGDLYNPDWAYYNATANNGCIYFNKSNGVLFDLKNVFNGCSNLSIFTAANTGNTAIRFLRSDNVTNVDGSVINCSIRNFDIAVDHYGRGLSFKRNAIISCGIGIKTTIANEPRWDHSNPTSSEIFQTHPRYNGRSLYMVDNRFHLTSDRYLLVVSEDYVSGGNTIKQVLNGAIISGNMGDLGLGSFEFQAPIKGCIFNGNEFLRISSDVFFDCKYGASECTISNNTIRGLKDDTYQSVNAYGKDCFVFNGLAYSSISGNVIESFKQRCFYCYGDGVNNCSITGNIFKNYGMDTSKAQYEKTGFDIPDCENSVIANNVFMTVSNFNGYLIRSRDISANVWKRNVFRDNTCTKRSSAEVLVPTTEGTEDNIIQGVS